MNHPHCCHIGEPKHPADLEITDEGERRPDMAITHSCHEHLAEMIGSVPPTEPVGPWVVRQLTDGEPKKTTTMEAFEKELKELINKHSIENVADMPDFVLAGMICRMIEAMGPSIKKTLDWHGCDSVCHPSKITARDRPVTGRRREGEVT